MQKTMIAVSPVAPPGKDLRILVVRAVGEIDACANVVRPQIALAERGQRMPERCFAVITEWFRGMKILMEMLCNMIFTLSGKRKLCFATFCSFDVIAWFYFGLKDRLSYFDYLFSLLWS